MNYDTFAKTALEQIKDKGRGVLLRSPADGVVYDPDTDTFTSADPVNSPEFKGLFTKFKLADIDGERIKRTDKRLLIAGPSLPAAPDTEDKIVDGADVYTVVNTEVVQPGETVILYMVQVRK